MSNTVQLHLLGNKQIKAEMQGIPLANDNAYRIIAGEENSTIFSIATKPTQYSAYDYYVILVNSQGFKVPLDQTEATVVEGEDGQLLIGSSFTLPNGMAVAGYGYIGIYAKGINAELENEKVIFQPVKIKVWNTVDNWKDNIPEDETVAYQSWVTANFATISQVNAKQDALTAGENITIVGNVISSVVNLSGYYNKQEVDGLLDGKIDKSATSFVTDTFFNSLY